MSVHVVGKRSQHWYGETVGILVVDARYPCVPGNVSNATTFPFPVRYEVVEGCSIDKLINHRDPGLIHAFIEAARKLEARGVKSIAGACGFMALFQEEVAAAVEVPVFLSSLMQIPFMHRITRKPVGIITAKAAELKDIHFERTGVSRDIPVAILGMDDQPEFVSAILEEKGTLDSALIEKEVTGVARLLKEQNPGIGSVLLECSDLPPYANAIQKEIDLPVFDFVTMINFANSSMTRAVYSGYI